jgi:hypothetical protein
MPREGFEVDFELGHGPFAPELLASFEPDDSELVLLREKVQGPVPAHVATASLVLGLLEDRTLVPLTVSVLEGCEVRWLSLIGSCSIYALALIGTAACIPVELALERIEASGCPPTQAPRYACFVSILGNVARLHPAYRTEFMLAVRQRVLNPKIPLAFAGAWAEGTALRFEELGPTLEEAIAIRPELRAHTGREGAWFQIPDLPAMREALVRIYGALRRGMDKATGFGHGPMVRRDDSERDGVQQPKVITASIRANVISRAFGIRASEVHAVQRNDLCPCGSGRKYKHCHERLEVPSVQSSNKR